MITVLKRYDNAICVYTNYVDENGNEWHHCFFKNPEHPVYRMSGAE
jgi:hypothetical protein